jgi:hypothetical protein
MVWVGWRVVGWPGMGWGGVAWRGMLGCVARVWGHHALGVRTLSGKRRFVNARCTPPPP